GAGARGGRMNYSNELPRGNKRAPAPAAGGRRPGARHAGKPEFVAAFAQTNAGDVTPNLNLNNTGPGKTDVESTRIIGERQARVAEKLFNQATETVSGPIGFRHAFVDFSRLDGADEVTGSG